MAKITLINFSLHLDPDSGEYYVEAKPAGKWITVDGPFATRDEAVDVARQYAIDNGVATRVVTSQ